MHIDIQARGFSLTPALFSAVESEVRAYERLFPELHASLHIRLSDVNGQRGGTDKCCLVSVRVGRRRKMVAVSDLNADMYRAIPGAFAKLERATRTSLAREQRRRMTPGAFSPEIPQER